MFYALIIPLGELKMNGLKCGKFAPSLVRLRNDRSISGQIESAREKREIKKRADDNVNDDDKDGEEEEDDDDAAAAAAAADDDDDDDDAAADDDDDKKNH
ncbi:hypothetical protein ElyMa_006417000 [Elysia marginata]|uniref:Uncharacterized protein n=1 Tax=Elysia marginata TaxID=1093978 RepID=A0AAV4HTK8_9GAST|nr:hypothetical protein ElyMa_006417000 [Elysia marginata]